MITALIPARGGSKTIPDKNILPLGEFPLIAYTIAAAKLSKLISKIVVTTDSEKIASISKKYGAEVPFLRPAKISQDTSTDIEFFQHFIDFYREKNVAISDYIVHLRPTTPLRDVSIMDDGIQRILDTPSAQSLRSVHRTSLTPHKIFSLEEGYLNGYFPEYPIQEYYNLPRQHFPPSYIPNGYVDVVRVSTIKTNVLHGKNMLGFVTEKVPDLDEYSDYEYAKNVLNNNVFEPIIQYLRGMNE